MNVCYIVGAAKCSRLPSPDKTDLVIAADGGYDTLCRAGIRCDLLIGDLDSIKERETDVETIKHPTMKDETDMHLAYLEGKKRGYTSFRLYGGVGGRVDHTFANYCLLSYISREGFEAVLYDREYIAYAITNKSTRVTGEKGKGISVFAFGGDASGVSIKGLYYEADGVTLTPSFPLGASNRKTGETAEISVKDGTLLIFEEI